MSEIYLHAIDRSDPDQIVAVYPKGHKEHPEGRKVTQLEVLQGESNWFLRDDIGIMTLPDGKTQILFFATKSGKVKCSVPWGKKLITPSEAHTLHDLARKLVATSKVHPEFEQFLHDD